MQSRQKGFTIVELLIVIVVIAILAAITIVAFNGIQSRANDTAVKSDIAAFAKKVELWRVDKGTYPIFAELSGYGIEFSRKSYYEPTGADQGNLIYCRSADGTAYGIAARSKSDKIFTVSSTNRNVSEYTQSTIPGSASTICTNISGTTPHAWLYWTTLGGWRI